MEQYVNILRKIAKANRTTIQEVYREMQAAIEAAYANPNFLALSIPCKNAIPTVEEFLDYTLISCIKS